MQTTRYYPSRTDLRSPTRISFSPCKRRPESRITVISRSPSQRSIINNEIRTEWYSNTPHSSRVSRYVNESPNCLSCRSRVNERYISSANVYDGFGETSDRFSDTISHKNSEQTCRKIYETVYVSRASSPFRHSALNTSRNTTRDRENEGDRYSHKVYISPNRKYDRPSRSPASNNRLRDELHNINTKLDGFINEIGRVDETVRVLKSPLKVSNKPRKSTIYANTYNPNINKKELMPPIRIYTDSYSRTPSISRVNTKSRVFRGSPMKESTQSSTSRRQLFIFGKKTSINVEKLDKLLHKQQ